MTPGPSHEVLSIRRMTRLSPEIEVPLTLTAWRTGLRLVAGVP